MEAAHCWCCMVNIQHGYRVKYMTPRLPHKTKHSRAYGLSKQRQANQNTHIRPYIYTHMHNASGFPQTCLFWRNRRKPACSGILGRIKHTMTKEEKQTGSSSANTPPPWHSLSTHSVVRTQIKDRQGLAYRYTAKSPVLREGQRQTGET